MKKVKALCLFSGGLDSQLAVCVLREQGIETHCVVFESPFFGSEHARRAASRLGVPLYVEDFTSEIMALLRKPPHGFGSCMNPCIDCHARMLRMAGGLLKKFGFDFLATGEVLGERPMSQTRESLRIIAMESGYGGLTLRPLSAKLLSKTLPEEQGLVDREKLLALQGRTRKPQIALAAKYGIKDYPPPAGGCLLTDPGFSRRLRDLLRHDSQPDIHAIELLKIGRHFRFPDGTKLVVGRNRGENNLLEGLADSSVVLFRIASYPGPLGVLSGKISDASISQAAAICARYSDAPKDRRIRVLVKQGNTLREVDVHASSDVHLKPI